MESQRSENPFAQDAHAKAQAAIDHAREVREKAVEELRKKHAEQKTTSKDVTGAPTTK